MIKLNLFSTLSSQSLGKKAIIPLNQIKLPSLSSDVVSFTKKTYSNRNTEIKPEPKEYIYTPENKLSRNYVMGYGEMSSSGHEIYNVKSSIQVNHSIKKLSTAFDLYFKKGVYYTIDDISKNEFALCLYTSIAKFYNDNNNKNLLHDTTSTENAILLNDYGFELSDPDENNKDYEKLNSALQNKDKSIIKTFINNNRDILFTMSKEKALDLKEQLYKEIQNTIQNNFQNDYDEVSSFAQRGELYKLPLNKKVKIGIDKDSDIKLSPNNTNKFSYVTVEKNSDNSITLTNSGDLVGELDGNSFVRCFPYDKTILPVNSLFSVDNDIFLNAKSGLRRISSNAADFIQNTNFASLAIAGFNNLKIKQGQIGDCSFIAALSSLSLKPEINELIPKMIKTDNKNYKYTVTFPGFPQNPIEISYNEFSSLLKDTDIVNAPNNKFVPLLEYSYSKLKESMNWKADVKSPNNWKHWITGVNANDALYSLTGATEKREIISKDESFYSDIDAKNEVKEIFNEVSNNPEDYVLTVGTSENITQNRSKNIFMNHSYAVKEIDNENETITLINPHDTNKEREYTFDEFFNYFDRLRWVKLPFRS